ncbi:G1/S-specific cyclin-E protein [Trema orientale]|uniref:G1/S-specific cyclin-E protein n=1 Tax=Trema orientale TaxID=63057 RepID=A0A2P5CID3_TREOI|nr:G1/S-specific cyclin-E protein [Trema orientale]
MDSCPDHLYPLTSLQIGDIKTNLSRAFLYFGPVSHKFFILVDNQSWRKAKHSRSTHIRAFVSMQLQYKTSPFRNTRPLLRSSSSSNYETESSFKWFPNFNMASWRDKAPFSIVKLYEELHGFIVFEVSWKDVRGINYLNELQTDGSIALEVKSLTKWEFNGIDQALSWSERETQILRSNLIFLQDKVPSHSRKEVAVSSHSHRPNDALQADEPFPEDEFFDVSESLSDENNQHLEEPDPSRNTEQNMEADRDTKCDTRPMLYTDILLLCRFNNEDLPFKLKQIITSDLKLLTLVESGLPSWVIFLQSYPLFCALYRPWMRPLFRTLYIIASLVTVIIGFYDLYKNVPLLKAAISHLCGPFFKWIESWEMVSRIKYLGTMLFLQNFEKAVKVFLMMIRAIKLLVSVITNFVMYPIKVLADFLMPLWSFSTDTIKEFYNIGLAIIEFLRSLFSLLVEDLIPPLEVLYSYAFSSAISIQPILSSLWGLFLFAIQSCLMLANYAGSLFDDIYEVLESCFMVVVNAMTQLMYIVPLKPNSSEFSLWHSLWKDIFSKVFRSIRSIIHVVSAFIASCNRHRLSIYNYLRAILWQLASLLGFSSASCSCRQSLQSNSHIKVDAKECEHCK